MRQLPGLTAAASRREAKTMNELLILLGAVRDGGWLVLCALLAIATGLFLLDRPAKAPAVHDAVEWPERRAA